MFSFSKRKKLVELYPRIRRLCDVTAAKSVTATEGRTENRYHRTIPTLLVPWSNGEPVSQDSVFALTKDIADRGVGLVVNQPFASDEVLVGYLVPSDDSTEAWFFLGRVKNNGAIGGGFYNMGVELTEFANPHHGRRLTDLIPLIDQLRAPEPVASP